MNKFSVSNQFKILLFALLITISYWSHAGERCVDDHDCSVSLIHLLGTPESYHNKTIIIRAFLEVKEGHAGLYLDSEKQKLGLSEYGVEVMLTPKQMKKYKPYHQHYVILYGRFLDIDVGDNGLFAGKITTVNEIRSLNGLLTR